MQQEIYPSVLEPAQEGRCSVVASQCGFMAGKYFVALRHLQQKLIQLFPQRFAFFSQDELHPTLMKIKLKQSIYLEPSSKKDSICILIEGKLAPAEKRA
jgi:hypothetical protein